MAHLWEFFRNLDESVPEMLKHYGPWSYGILFAILFAETGFVVTPFLPGDTLLFAAGLFSRPDSAVAGGLNIWLVLPILTIAPLAGDNVNYFFGRWLGPKLFHNPKSRIFKKENLDKTHEFFEKYGSKTVILARWIPIVRTFSPFVAGMGSMPYRKFLTYSVIGAVLWVWTLVGAGYFLAKTPIVRDNVGWAMIIMVLITGGPVVLEFLRNRRQSKRTKAEPVPVADSPTRITKTP